MIVAPVREAEAEIAEAVEFHQTRSAELSQRFLIDLEAAVAKIIEFPNAHPPLRGGFRRILLARFPYQIVYRVEGETIRIYAVAHLKRRPGYWRKRTAR